MRSVIAAACFGAIFVSACTLLVSTDDLSAARGSPDGGTRSDGGPPADAAAITEDATTADGAPAGGCAKYAPAPTFCDEFDRPALQGAWDDTSNKNAALEIVQTESNGSPRSLHVQMLSSGSYAYLTKCFDVTSRVRFAFDTKIVSGPTAATHATALRAVPAPDGYSSVHVFFEPFADGSQTFTDEVIATGQPSVLHRKPVNPPLPLGKWVNVRFELVVGGAPTVTLYVDDYPFATSTLAPTAVWSAGKWCAVLGFDYGPTATGLDEYFDNVAVWVD